MNSLLIAILCGLAGWRMANLLAFEDGPFGIFQKFRDLIGIKPGPIEGFLPTLFSCIYCLSLWMALGAYVIWLLIPEAAIVIAAAAVIILVDKAARE